MALFTREYRGLAMAGADEELAAWPARAPPTGRGGHICRVVTGRLLGGALVLAALAGGCRLVAPGAALRSRGISGVGGLQVLASESGDEKSEHKAALLHEEKVATPEVQKLCDDVKESVPKLLAISGWKGLELGDYKAVTYCTDSMNYIVKLKADVPAEEQKAHPAGLFLELLIRKPLELIEGKKEPALFGAMMVTPVAPDVCGSVAVLPKTFVPEAPKLDAVKVELPKADLPKVEMPEVEMPEVEMPEEAMPQVEMPEVEMPKVEMPEVELPEVELPKVEMPKVEPPEVESPEAWTSGKDASVAEEEDDDKEPKAAAEEDEKPAEQEEPERKGEEAKPTAAEAKPAAAEAKPAAAEKPEAAEAKPVAAEAKPAAAEAKPAAAEAKPASAENPGASEAKPAAAEAKPTAAEAKTTAEQAEEAPAKESEAEKALAKDDE